MNDCPCKNCLVFPICKAQALEYIKSYSSPPPNIDRVYGSIIYAAYKPTCGFNLYTDILDPKCSLITKWINQDNINVYKRYAAIYYIFKQRIINEKLSMYKLYNIPNM